MGADECGNTEQTCINGRCVHACTTVHCASNAVCVVENEVPQCKCLKGFEGDGFTSCDKLKMPPTFPECAIDGECEDKESCINGMCQSPCMGTCGQGAECISKYTSKGDSVDFRGTRYEYFCCL